MSGPIHVHSCVPNECSDKEIEDFAALVAAGGEVELEGLEARVRSAICLVFLSLGPCLVGVAGLKKPSERHRKEVSDASGVSLPAAQVPYELGWVFVMPSARGKRFSVELTRAAVDAAAGAGLFATSRTDNANMHATLMKFGFKEVGKKWRSKRGRHSLMLFMRLDAERPNVT